MTNPTPGRPPAACEIVQLLAAELALGSLTGDERSLALAHLEQCEICRQIVEGLSQAADALLLAAPEADPPVGFEVGLLQRLRDGTGEAGVAEIQRLGDLAARASARQAKRMRRMVVGIAAATLVALGAGIGIGELAAPSSGSPTAKSIEASGGLRLAPLVEAHGESDGVVVLANGRPGWVLMTVQDMDGVPWVQCVVQKGGHVVTIGSFELNGGYGSWSAPLPSSWKTGDITSARVIAPNGKVLATASF